MTILPRKLAVCAALLFVSTIAAAAQSTPGGEQAATTDGTQTAALATEKPLPPIRTPSVSELRRLFDDPQIRNFKGLSENAWDFTDPHSIPGFAKDADPFEFDP
ncbi:MAG: hypothetical protein ACXWJW_09015 [Xanthobacteraceae bacterium]